MKTALFRCLAFSLLLLATTQSLAQARTAPLASLGYWNVETNLTTRDHSIVRFYDHQNQLVYEERLPNLCLDLSKGTSCCRRTSRQLGRTLRLVLREPAVCASGTLLAQKFDSDRRSQRAYAAR
ncbi:hypothetical protein [uncultured Hymenobacter sp.]|uniref:hypothetical protein n=1 Tax=uncultured Hymenobacter sp. TaxID=170016 RepID=UPI0035CBCAFA